MRFPCIAIDDLIPVFGGVACHEQVVRSIVGFLKIPPKAQQEFSEVLRTPL